MRNELERKSTRTEKDCTLHKEEKVHVQQSHKQELKETKLQHEELLDETTLHRANQTNTLMKQIKEMKHMRLKEISDCKNKL